MCSTVCPFSSSRYRCHATLSGKRTGQARTGPVAVAHPLPGTSPVPGAERVLEARVGTILPVPVRGRRPRSRGAAQAAPPIDPTDPTQSPGTPSARRERAAETKMTTTTLTHPPPPPRAGDDCWASKSRCRGEAAVPRGFASVGAPPLQIPTRVEDRGSSPQCRSPATVPSRHVRRSRVPSPDDWTTGA